LVGGGEDAVEKLAARCECSWALPRSCCRGGYHAIFAPLFFVRASWLRRSVGKGEEHVAGGMGMVACA